MEEVAGLIAKNKITNPNREGGIKLNQSQLKRIANLEDAEMRTTLSEISYGKKAAEVLKAEPNFIEQTEVKRFIINTDNYQSICFEIDKGDLDVIVNIKKKSGSSGVVVCEIKQKEEGII